MLVIVLPLPITQFNPLFPSKVITIIIINQTINRLMPTEQIATDPQLLLNITPILLDITLKHMISAIVTICIIMIIKGTIIKANNNNSHYINNRAIIQEW